MALLDEIDRKLLALLQEDDRVPVVELGKAIGVAPSTLNDRIRRLVKQGIIKGFHAQVSAEKLGSTCSPSSLWGGATRRRRRSSCRGSPRRRRCWSAITSPAPGTT
jgi:DNA-binding Lrp family transcriptional regulator